MLALPPSMLVPIGFGVMFSMGELLTSPTLDALTGEVRSEGNGLTRAYGWTSMVSGVSSIIGSSLGGMLIDLCGGVRGSLALCLPAAVIAFLCIIHLRREIEPTREGTSSGRGCERPLDCL
ncbi:MFS transporter [Bifidobacterium lemurum]|nr:MFS transporter [Bifidobacterium lemurum]